MLAVMNGRVLVASADVLASLKFVVVVVVDLSDGGG